MRNQFSKFASVSPRTKKINRIFLCILAFLVVSSILLPDTGALVLLDEFCGVAMFWTVMIWCAVLVAGFKKRSAAKATRSKKDILIFLVAIALILFVVFLSSKNLVLDLIHGEQTIVLNQCAVEKTSTSKGIISLDYYLLGYDEYGEMRRFAISDENYYALLNRYGEYHIGGWTATVQGYPHTGRVISIG